MPRPMWSGYRERRGVGLDRALLVEAARELVPYILPWIVDRVVILAISPTSIGGRPAYCVGSCCFYRVSSPREEFERPHRTKCYQSQCKVGIGYSGRRRGCLPPPTGWLSQIAVVGKEYLFANREGCTISRLVFWLKSKLSEQK